MSAAVVLACPFSVATCRGVVPESSCAIGSASAARSVAMALAWPFSAAMCRGVVPEASFAIGSAPAARSAAIDLAEPPLAAACRGVTRSSSFAFGSPSRPRKVTFVRTRRRCARIKGSAGNPGIGESRGRGVGELVAVHPEAVPGHATAVTESTRFAGPPLALRPWRVTRRRRRRGGCPWPEGSFRPSVARQRRTRSARHARKRLSGRTRPRRELVMRTWSGARLWIRRPARALHPNRPPACSLAAFEPSLHFVDFIHALDDDAAGRGGDFVLEAAEADADVDAPHDGSLDDLRIHVGLL